MKRITIGCLVLVGCLAAVTSAYLVHEEPEEDDESVRGKRQQNGAVVIDSIFNIPITAIKQTAAAAQTLSPENAGTIDSVLKIPVTTLEAVSNLIKNRQQNRQTTPLSVSRPTRRLHLADAPITTPANDPQRRRREENKRRVEAQREQQRLYHAELQRRRMEKMRQYSRRMEQQIADEDARTHHGFYRDPFGFNALTKWLVGPHGVFNGHTGHGDGHVYQFFDQLKPLHFGGHHQQQHGGHHQGIHRPIPTKPTLPIGSSTISSTSTSTTTTTSSTSSAGPSHTYEVHEVVDEGINPFAWPNWFGIIGAALNRPNQWDDTRIQNKIAPKNTKVKFDEPPLENKIAPKDDEYYKTKYAQARKNYNVLELEITGNEIDGEVGSGENNQKASGRAGKVVFPN